MLRDHEKMAMFRRGKHGALISCVPATGSGLPGGSVTHKSGRKKINNALRTGKPILCRASNKVALRLATYIEVIRARRTPDGTILVMDALGEDGITWGCNCVIRSESVPIGTPMFDPTPRLVRNKE